MNLEVQTLHSYWDSDDAPLGVPSRIFRHRTINTANSRCWAASDDSLVEGDFIEIPVNLINQELFSQADQQVGIPE